MATIRFRRGINNNRSQLVPVAGEPVWTTDTKKLFVGDGSTVGGIPVCPYETSAGAAADSLVAFSDATGFKFKPISKAMLLADYYTSAQADAKEAALKAGNVASATLADNSNKFGGELPASFVKQAQVTQSFSESSASKVPSAAALSNAYNDLNSKVASATADLTSKVAKSDISISTSSESQSTVAASSAVKAAYDWATQANTKGTQAINASSDAKVRADQAYTLAQTAQNTAKDAAWAPALQIERKRLFTYGTFIPEGVTEEGHLYVQY